MVEHTNTGKAPETRSDFILNKSKDAQLTCLSMKLLSGSSVASCTVWSHLHEWTALSADLSPLLKGELDSFSSRKCSLQKANFSPFHQQTEEMWGSYT